MRLWIFPLLVCLQVHLVYGDYRTEVNSLYSALINGVNPDVRPESTVQVSVGLTVFNMDLDSLDETLTVNGKLTVMWTDSPWALGSNEFSHEMFHVHDGVLWRPELVVENMIDEISVIDDKNLMYRLHYTGTTTWEPAVHATVHCPHDFTYYPFDKQTCSITLSSWSYDDSETRLQHLHDKVNLDLYREKSEFKVKETRVETSTVTESQGSRNRTYSKLNFYITVQRNTPFYGLTIILPLLLLSALTTLTFLLPLESGEKANYSVTVLLMIVLLYSVALMNYPVFTGVSVLAIYAAVVLILAILAVLCNLLVLYLYHQDKHREMSSSLRSVLQILEKLVCRHGLADDTRSIVLSEETTSSRLSDNDLHACSSLPNGNLGNKKPGRLSPINRRVGPSFVESETGTSAVHHEPMPPLNKPETSRNTPNVAEFVKVSHFIDKRNQQRENNRSLWHEMSLCLDRLLFVVFIIVSFITHFVCLIVLCTGST